VDSQCIKTDDKTVWYLVYPLLIFPIYIICMFIGRSSRRKMITQR
jgi:hypothetical protein